MNNWVKMTNDEMEVGIEIATLKKGELQIKYAKDIVAKNKEIERLNNIINKAIEYIENNQLYFEDYDFDINDEMYLTGIDDKQASEDLINILKGVDKK